MEGFKQDNVFRYTEPFDNLFLDELYGGDTRTAAQLFAVSMEQLVDAVRRSEQLMQEGDIRELQRLFHKIRPLFGYMGLMPVQDFVQQFESQCAVSTSVSELQIAYENIREIIREALDRVRAEQQRLADYNNRNA